MNQSFSIVAVEPAVLKLRTIEMQDLTDLRIWKNANRESFFFKGEITPAEQQRWFGDYLTRSDDYMFLVESGPLRVGCMGFRLKAGSADTYNIIGSLQARGQGLMSRAMALMCCYIKATYTPRVGCMVLKNNPAISWYKKIGYYIAADCGDYYQMEIEWDKMLSVSYRVVGRGRDDD